MTLAKLGKALKDINKELFESTFYIVKPKTVMAWHTKFVKNKWGFSALRKKVSRPKTDIEIEKLVLKITRETVEGITKVYGRIKNLNVNIKRSTVRTIMRNNGFPPKKSSNEYDPSWEQFLDAHNSLIVGCDFFTVEVWNKLFTNTTRCFVLVFIHHGSRKIWFGRVTPNPTAEWTIQAARNFVYDLD